MSFYSRMNAFFLNWSIASGGLLNGKMAYMLDLYLFSLLASLNLALFSNFILISSILLSITLFNSWFFKFIDFEISRAFLKPTIASPNLPRCSSSTAMLKWVIWKVDQKLGDKFVLRFCFFKKLASLRVPFLSGGAFLPEFWFISFSRAISSSYSKQMRHFWVILRASLCLL